MKSSACAIISSRVISGVGVQSVAVAVWPSRKIAVRSALMAFSASLVAWAAPRGSKVGVAAGASVGASVSLGGWAIGVGEVTGRGALLLVASIAAAATMTRTTAPTAAYIQRATGCFFDSTSVRESGIS